MQAPQNLRDGVPSRDATSVAAEYGVGVRDSSVSLKDLLGIVRRRRVIVLLTICGITGFAALLAFQLTPRYTATADVMITPRQLQVIDLGSVVREVPPDRATIETELDVLTSGSYAQRVIEQLGLLSDPEFNPLIMHESGRPPLLAKLTDWMAQHWPTSVGTADQLFPSSWGPWPERSDDIEQPGSYEYERQLEAAVRRLLQDLRVSQAGDSYVISVGFTSTEPEKAARIANTVAELYVAGQRQDKLAATKDAVIWLAERAKRLRQEVIESERAIEEYRFKNSMISSQRGSLSEQELASLNLELITARAERAEKEVRLQRVREVLRSGARYEALTDVISSPIIIDLRQQEAAVLREEAQLSREYGPFHPRMLETAAEKENLAVKIDLEIGNIIANLENEVGVARSRERAIAEALDEAKDRSAVISQAEIQLRQLEREAGANRSLYQTFLTRLKQTEEQLDLIKADARVVSPASIPQYPSFPKPKLMIGIGFTSSVVLGVLMALLRERLDSAFRTGRELHELLGVASFGLVPSIRRGRRQPKPYRYLIEKPLSAYADAIRSVQKLVELSGADRRSRVVLVTSTLPREGKTTLVLSLAASVARSGRKTVVVDVDLRSPSIAREINQPFGPGLVEFLAGDATEDEIVHAAEFQTNLHFIPVKGMTSSPVDLLESGKMSTLLTELRTKYDYVFLDAPPALVTDARAAALLADTILYAVQWNKTKMEFASHGLESLAASGISVAGLIMTQVDLKRHGRSGYGDVASYYSSYRKYYVD